MVGSFADASGTPEVSTERLRIEPGPDEDMLVAVLDEVVFLMDTTGRLPIGAEATDVEGGGLEVRLRMAEADRMEPVGAVPKAVSLHELRFGRDERGWSCTVTLDI